MSCYEQLGSWSLSNLVRQEGELAVRAIDDFRKRIPELNIQFYNSDDTFRSLPANICAKPTGGHPRVERPARREYHPRTEAEFGLPAPCFTTLIIARTPTPQRF